MFLYFPARPLTEGLAETMVVWLEAALVVAGAAFLLRRKPMAAIPVAVFIATAMGLGAWDILHVMDWFPAQS